MKKVICILSLMILLLGTSAMAGLTPGTYSLPSLSDPNPTWSELWKGAILGPGQAGNELQASGSSFSMYGAILSSVAPAGGPYWDFTTIYNGGTLELKAAAASWGGPAIINNIDFVNSTKLLLGDPTGPMQFYIIGTGMYGSQPVTLEAWFLGQPDPIIDPTIVTHVVQIGQTGPLYDPPAPSGTDWLKEYAFSNGASITIGTPVPVPAAIWLLGSGLLGLLRFRRKFSK